GVSYTIWTAVGSSSTGSTVPVSLRCIVFQGTCSSDAWRIRSAYPTSSPNTSSGTSCMARLTLATTSSGFFVDIRITIAHVFRKRSILWTYRRGDFLSPYQLSRKKGAFYDTETTPDCGYPGDPRRKRGHAFQKHPPSQHPFYGRN